jgi:hypothetical protein
MDDFISWVDIVGWWPRFEAQVLNPLLSGGDAHYQVRDWENDELGTSLNGWKTVEWTTQPGQGPICESTVARTSRTIRSRKSCCSTSWPPSRRGPAKNSVR